MASGFLTFGLLTPQIGSAGPFQGLQSLVDRKIDLGATPVMALAREGVPSGGIAGGGGNAVNGRLFDFYENNGTVEIQLEEQPFYTSDVLPEIRRIQKDIPEFADFLKQAMQLKRWFIESKPIKGEGCLNPSMIQAEQKIVACQDRHQVRLSKKELTAMSSLNRAGLIIHELLLAHGLEMLNPEDRLSSWRNKANIENGIYVQGPVEVQKNVRDLVRSLFDPAVRPSALRERFATYGFVQFMTVTEESVLRQTDVAYRKYACSLLPGQPQQDKERLKQDAMVAYSQCYDGGRIRCETGLLEPSSLGGRESRLYETLFADDFTPYSLGRDRVGFYFRNLRMALDYVKYGIRGFVPDPAVSAAVMKAHCTDFSGRSFTYIQSPELKAAFDRLQEN